MPQRGHLSFANEVGQQHVTGPSDITDHEFRSRCSIARTLDLIGDKWTLLIIRDLLWHDKHTFQALQDSRESVPSNILSDRLRRLMQWGLVEREAYQKRPVRYSYHLTDTGQALEPVLRLMMKWGHEFLDGGYFDPDDPQTSSAKTSRQPRK